MVYYFEPYFDNSKALGALFIETDDEKKAYYAECRALMKSGFTTLAESIEFNKYEFEPYKDGMVPGTFEHVQTWSIGNFPDDIFDQHSESRKCLATLEYLRDARVFEGVIDISKYLCVLPDDSRRIEYWIVGNDKTNRYLFGRYGDNLVTKAQLQHIQLTHEMPPEQVAPVVPKRLKRAQKTKSGVEWRRPRAHRHKSDDTKPKVIIRHDLGRKTELHGTKRIDTYGWARACRYICLVYMPFAVLLLRSPADAQHHTKTASWLSIAIFEAILALMVCWFVWLGSRHRILRAVYGEWLKIEDDQITVLTSCEYKWSEKRHVETVVIRSLDSRLQKKSKQ